MATIRKNYDGVGEARTLHAGGGRASGSARIRTQVGYDGFDDGRPGHRGGVREHGAQEGDLRRARRAWPSPGAILATNTSTLDIDEIAAATTRPGQASSACTSSARPTSCGCVEIVRGAATAPETLATALALAKRLGKVGVVVGNCPGFVGNRMMFPYMYEAQFLVEDGATPEQVDRALTDFGMAMGIFAVDDMAGLDVAWRVRQELEPVQRARRAQAARRRHARARWAASARRPARAGTATATTASRCPIRRCSRSSSGWPPPPASRAAPFTNDEIIERTIYALINEGARVLEEGVALRAADIDVIYINGYGFPAWRGGPMFYADRVGLAKIHERVVGVPSRAGPAVGAGAAARAAGARRSTFQEFDKRRAGARVGAGS